MFKRVDFKKVRHNLLVALLIFGVSVALAIFMQYRFGTSNHGETIPIHSRLEDPEYLKEDYFVNSLAQFNVRSTFSYLMYATKQVSGAEGYSTVYFFYYILTNMGSVWALLLILGQFEKRGLSKVFFTILIFLTTNLQLGNTYLITSQLLPSSFAITLLLFAIYLSLRRNYTYAVLLLAIASYFQLVIGVHGFMIVAGAALLAKGSDLREKLQIGAKMAFTYLIPLAPLLYLTFFNQLGGEQSVDIGYIIGEFRNPHHYLPSAWNLGRVLNFLIFDLLTVSSLLYLRQRKPNRDIDQIFYMVLILNIMFIAGYIFVDVWPVTTIVKMQLFRTSFLLSIIGKVCILTALGCLITSFLSLQPHLVAKLKLGAVVLLITTVTISIYRSKPLQLEIAQPATGVEQQELYSWIRSSTRPESIFIISPMMDDFRIGAERGVVITFKQFMFKDNEVEEWYNRIADLCGMEAPQCSGWGCRAHCEKEYNSYKEKEFSYLANKYRAQYIVVDSETELPFSRVYTDQYYSVYTVEFK